MLRLSWAVTIIDIVSTAKEQKLDLCKFSIVSTSVYTRSMINKTTESFTLIMIWTKIEGTPKHIHQLHCINPLSQPLAILTTLNPDMHWLQKYFQIAEG
jgi:hypothetical protein